MKTKTIAIGALLGALTSLPVIGLMYLGDQLAGLPFVPFDIFDWLTRVLPGGVITPVIDLMVGLITRLDLGETSSTAKTTEQVIAILQVIAGGAVFGLVLAANRNKRPQALTTYGVIGGLILLALTLIVENSLGFPPAGVATSAFWLAILYIGWGWVLGRLVYEADPNAQEDEHNGLSRRQFLSLTGFGAVVISLGALGLARLLRVDEEEVVVIETVSQPDDDLVVPEPDPFGAAETSGPAASPSPEELAARTQPVDGTRPELTSNDDFYRIDINTRPTRVDIDAWRLQVSGLVENPLSLSIEDIRAFPTFTQILTMQCISNPVGGDLTGTTRWTGARLKDVLDAAGMHPGAQEAQITAADGFYESVKMQDILDERTLLVYDMNSVPLPVPHGYPLRVYVPNRYGMKQPKWIETIEIIDHEATGFWVGRGWSKEAIAKATSVIDTVAVDVLTGTDGEPQVAVGGIAWAGARGIEKVEVQVDEGPWELAEILAPPLSPLTWVQWRYDWPHEEGRHVFNVRCYDGTGEMQTSEDSSPRPDGATGIHSLAVRI
ncbi:MAG: molybdopterin-dependent oxidoreductase [Chloroflexi bacterium]|nr:molybdopterin-dependent oxidoreductase [Chloroflexota bacterium]